jgi:hypothetical protein
MCYILCILFLESLQISVGISNLLGPFLLSFSVRLSRAAPELTELLPALPVVLGDPCRPHLACQWTEKDVRSATVTMRLGEAKREFPSLHLSPPLPHSQKGAARCLGFMAE